MDAGGLYGGSEGMKIEINIVGKREFQAEIRKAWLNSGHSKGEANLEVRRAFYPSNSQPGFYVPRTGKIFILNTLNLMGKVATIAHEVLHALGIRSELAIDDYLKRHVVPLLAKELTANEDYFDRESEHGS